MAQNTNSLKKSNFDFSTYWLKYGTAAILILMVAVFGALQPKAFLSGNNLMQIVIQSSVTILIACGEFFAILLAGIDLSVGSTLALTGMVTAKLMAANVAPIWAVLLGSILLGIAIGAFNGLLVNVTGLHPFVITLGTQAILRGLVMIISDARAVANLPRAFASVVGGRVLGIPMPILIAVGMAAILTFITLKTQLGRNLYALGGNKQAAWFAGINVFNHTMAAFVLSGLCAGIAGMVNIARLGAAEPNAGTGYETFAIASAIIGGTSFFGGKGIIPKVVVGGLVIGVINNGLNMMSVSSYYQTVAMGSLIIIAVTLDRFFGASRKV